MENLLWLVIVLVIIGVLLWLVQEFLPIDSRIKTLIVVVVVIGALLYIASMFLGSVNLPR